LDKKESIIDLKEIQNSTLDVNKKIQSGVMESNIKVYVLRLKPNQDLFKELDTFVKEKDLKAAFILTCVGSVTKGFCFFFLVFFFKNSLIKLNINDLKLPFEWRIAIKLKMQSKFFTNILR
jgi:hypothetical protein